jgi:hypothetical protein
MAKQKEEEFETLEGGDASSDALGHSDMNDKSKQTDEDDVSFIEPGDKHTVLEGGDEEWKVPEDGADLDKSGEEDVDDKDVEDDADDKDDDDKSDEDKQDDIDKKIMDDTIKYLEESGGTKYRIKGKEYDLKDLSPQEFRDRFSKAGRFYERMQELADKEKLLTERERLAEEGARQSQEILSQYGKKQREADKVEIPEFLKPDDKDTDLERKLKEMNANLLQRVDKLEDGMTETTRVAGEQQLDRELGRLEQDFPMLSREEVVAVLSFYPDSDIKVVAENSHRNRVSDEYIDTVLKHRPDKLREIEERAVEKHLKTNPNVRRVSRKKSSTTASKKISTKKKFTPRTFDEIEANYDQMKKGYEESLRDMD